MSKLNHNLKIQIMSPLKKGIILQKETVETVGSFGLCFINPQLKLGVNSKLRSLITVSTVFMIFKIRSKYFNFKSFLNGLNNRIENFLYYI